MNEYKKQILQYRNQFNGPRGSVETPQNIAPPGAPAQDHEDIESE